MSDSIQKRILNRINGEKMRIDDYGTTTIIISKTALLPSQCKQYRAQFVRPLELLIVHNNYDAVKITKFEEPDGCRWHMSVSGKFGSISHYLGKWDNNQLLTGIDVLHKICSNRSHYLLRGLNSILSSGGNIYLDRDAK